MNKLFVYGIFLDEYNRRMYGMSNPRYATVLHYATVGYHIVKAVKIEGTSLALSGLIVDVDPSRWGDIDQLEGGYERIRVKTTNGDEAYMYAEREWNGQE